jgi:hypothetical protein
MSTGMAPARAGFPTPSTCTKILLDCILAFRIVDTEADPASGPIDDDQSRSTPQTMDIDRTRFAANGRSDRI